MKCWTLVVNRYISIAAAWVVSEKRFFDSVGKSWHGLLEAAAVPGRTEEIRWHHNIVGHVLCMKQTSALPRAMATKRRSPDLQRAAQVPTTKDMLQTVE